MGASATGPPCLSPCPGWYTSHSSHGLHLPKTAPARVNLAWSIGPAWHYFPFLVQSDPPPPPRPACIPCFSEAKSSPSTAMLVLLGHTVCITVVVHPVCLVRLRNNPGTWCLSVCTALTVSCRCLEVWFGFSLGRIILSDFSKSLYQH